MAKIVREEGSDRVTLTVQPLPESRPLMTIAAEIKRPTVASRTAGVKVRFSGVANIEQEMLTLSEVGVWSSALREILAAAGTERDRIKEGTPKKSAARPEKKAAAKKATKR